MLLNYKSQGPCRKGVPKCDENVVLIYNMTFTPTPTKELGKKYLRSTYQKDIIPIAIIIQSWQIYSPYDLQFSG